MKCFQIGRKPAGFWSRATPPIGGAAHRVQATSHPPAHLQFQSSEKERLLSVASASAVYDSDTDSTTDDNGSHFSSDREGSVQTSFTSEESDADSISDVKIKNDEKTSSSSSSPLAEDPAADGGVRLRAHACAKARAAYLAEAVASRGPQLSEDVHFLDEVNASAESRAQSAKATFVEWSIRQDAKKDLAEYPPVDVEVQEEIVRKYRIMHQKIIDAGLYDCPYLDYGKEMVRYLTLFALFLTTLNYGWYMTSAVFLGLFWHQLMFTAHDAGHRAITKNFTIDTLIGMFIADFCCGLSIGWWKSSHNVHHLLTNQPEHDPDIQNVPLFATSPKFFDSLRSTYYDGFVFVWDAVADFLVPLQHYTYYPIMGVARFNLYFLSWLHVISSKSSTLGSTKAWWIRPGEALFMACFWYIFGYRLIICTLPTWPVRVAFVLVSHIVTMPLHVQITLSHWAMSTSDLGDTESFPQRQLRTTMDVDCPAWLDFIHGGLQFQAVHHLFPRVPRHNLRKVQVLVREFCAETGIPYSILGFVDSNAKVVSRLSDLGKQVKIMIECQKYMAETGESGLH
ncbi:related to delta-5/delta-6 fatty acid desaturase [Cephalotrichum gorgonifer]|uniref:Related to delta-5/delta-6 fatty acid desaturase n=1 Tax=Cephalotrichum gorgonifer TaxID=2041049 RepID=A0AAE8SY91_9PEZI|nr:related to delta-5/delta-6 fatty acid desaturase [Cephalotrichum gorgonifer]